MRKGLWLRRTFVTSHRKNSLISDKQQVKQYQQNEQPTLASYNCAQKRARWKSKFWCVTGTTCGGVIPTNPLIYLFYLRFVFYNNAMFSLYMPSNLLTLYFVPSSAKMIREWKLLSALRQIKKFIKKIESGSNEVQQQFILHLNRFT